MLPAGVRSAVEGRIGAVRDVRPVGGGCVNPAARLDLAAGPVFLKYNLDAPPGMFAAEAEGLEALRTRATGLRVPAVVAVGEPSEGERAGWLALEWLEPAAPAAGYAQRLGRGLAELHRPIAGGWGWERDGFIGPLPQANAALPSWGGFWRDRRLEPQLRSAYERGFFQAERAEWDRLLARVPALLQPAEEEGPSLLHGDLWSGNVLATREGAPALVDPASYRGHREVDLAMSELFGGFPAGFLAAYTDAAPLAPGYREARRALYQLYFLLVHVNLFGGSYPDRTLRTLRGLPSTT
jgi:fructosamine-3-kinase